MEQTNLTNKKADYNTHQQPAHVLNPSYVTADRLNKLTELQERPLEKLQAHWRRVLVSTAVWFL